MNSQIHSVDECSVSSDIPIDAEGNDELALPEQNICVDYNDDTMGAIASQITRLTIVYSIVYSDVDKKKHQSSASLAFVREFTGDR